MKKSEYTCNDYREEMMLLGLKKRFYDKNFSDEEKRRIKKEIEKLELRMEMQ